MKDLIEDYFDRLWPICRSITGNGVRETLEILKEIVPLEVQEIATGTQVFDWEVPKEWNIQDAHIITPEGHKICDFKVSNLHVVNYSIPVNMELEYADLEKHLHYLIDQPDLIPYVTTYYKETWGFCLTYEDFLKLPKKGTYKVVVDSELKEGSMTLSDCILPGESDKEILFTTYVCHPSLAINELSGPLVTAFLYRELAKLKNRKYTYRFVFAPETIGHIAYLSQVGEHLKEKVIAGYVLTCVGSAGAYTYKKSKRDTSLADKVALHVLENSGAPFKVEPFSIGGSDERQYCSPGFNLPVGSLMKTPYKQYEEYHASGDNKDIICFQSMEDIVKMYVEICECIELNDSYTRVNPYCEYQLGKRGLYDNSERIKENPDFVFDLLHFLSYVDGEMELLEISEKRGKSMSAFKEIVSVCKSHDLIY